jgi:hypothetical protein
MSFEVRVRCEPRKPGEYYQDPERIKEYSKGVFESLIDAEWKASQVRDNILREIGGPWDYWAASPAQYMWQCSYYTVWISTRSLDSKSNHPLEW